MGKRGYELSKKRLDPAIAASRNLAANLAGTLDKKKGDEIEVLGLTGISLVTDFFVLGAGFARIQAQALADAALEAARSDGHKPRSIEGYGESGWILLDFGDVVVHLMTHEARDYYRLDRLWGDAPRLDWNTVLEEMEKA